MIELTRKNLKIVTKDFLKQKGFHKSDSIMEWDNREKNRSDYYALRVSDTLWIGYDLKSGFPELRHVKEGDRKRDKIIRISLPKPLRTKKELNDLLGLLT